MVSEKIISFLKNEYGVRVLAFGSSNTQRIIEGMHWFDCFGFAVNKTFGRSHHYINTGIGGNTARDLLDRFERDASFYKPHIVFITIGGNDSNPKNNFDISEYERSILELYNRFSDMGTEIIFQTYYSPDPDLVEKQHHENFFRYMDIVRNTASKKNCGLIDHLARWEPLRKEYTEKYKKMMKDGFHVNMNGNLVLGLHIAENFKADPGNERSEYWQNARQVNDLMNKLSTA